MGLNFHSRHTRLAYPFLSYPQFLKSQVSVDRCTNSFFLQLQRLGGPVEKSMFCILLLGKCRSGCISPWVRQAEPSNKNISIMPCVHRTSYGLENVAGRYGTSCSRYQTKEIKYAALHTKSWQEHLLVDATGLNMCQYPYHLILVYCVWQILRRKIYLYYSTGHMLSIPFTDHKRPLQSNEYTYIVTYCSALLTVWLFHYLSKNYSGFQAERAQSYRDNCSILYYKKWGKGRESARENSIIYNL